MITSNNITKHCTLLLTMCITSLSWGQAIMAGTVLTSGAQLVSSGSTTPTYSARTDNCELGTESGCGVGATTGQAGSPMSFLSRQLCTALITTNCDNVPFAWNAPADTDAYDPDFNSHLLLLTDQTTSYANSGQYWQSFNLGSGGQGNIFSVGNKMLVINNQYGLMRLVYLDVTKFRAAAQPGGTPCSSSICTYLSSIYSEISPPACTYNCTWLDINDVYTFSTQDPYVLFELAGVSPSIGPLRINKLEICPKDGSGPYCNLPVCQPSSSCTSDTFVRVPYVNFTSDSPVACNVLPPSYTAYWSGTFFTNNNGAFTLGLAGGADWQANTAYSINDWTSFIVPSSGNSRVHGYQAVRAGTTCNPSTGCSEPVWASTVKGDTLCDPNTGDDSGGLNVTCASGQVTWKDIGIVSGQDYGFDVVNYTPNVGCSAVNTFIGQVRRNATAYAAWGNGIPPAPWQTDDPLLCQPWGVTPSNPPSGTCPLTRTPSRLHNTSTLPNSEYAEIANNVGGPSGGTWISSTAYYTGPWVSGQTYSLSRSVVYDPIEVASGALNFYSPATCPTSTTCTQSSTITHPAANETDWILTANMSYGMTWDIPTLTFRTCTQMQCTGHADFGYSNMWSGGAYTQRSYDQPEYYLCYTSSRVPAFAVTEARNHFGGVTTYVGTFPNGDNNAFAGVTFVVAGFTGKTTSTADNGTFTATASTATTLTLSNSAGVAATQAATASPPQGNKYVYYLPDTLPTDACYSAMAPNPFLTPFDIVHYQQNCTSYSPRLYGLTLQCAAGDYIYDESNTDNPNVSTLVYISGGTFDAWNTNNMLPGGFPADTHESNKGLGTQDEGIVTFFVDDVPATTLGNSVPSSGYFANPMATYYQEVVGGATGLPTSAQPPIGTFFRFAHNFNTGSSPLFDDQNGIGNVSQDGQFAAIPTDVMGTRSSASRAWAARHTYTWGDYIYPVDNNGGGGSGFSATGYDYQVTAVGGNSSPTPGTTGTTGATEPNWDASCATTCTDGTGGTQITWTRQPASCNQLRGSDLWAAGKAAPAGMCIYDYKTNTDIYCTSAGGTTGSTKPSCPQYGSTCSDGGVTWTNMGQNDCRSDIVLVDLVSAH